MANPNDTGTHSQTGSPRHTLEGSWESICCTTRAMSWGWSGPGAEGGGLENRNKGRTGNGSSFERLQKVKPGRYKGFETNTMKDTEKLWVEN